MSSALIDMCLRFQLIRFEVSRDCVLREGPYVSRLDFVKEPIRLANRERVEVCGRYERCQMKVQKNPLGSAWLTVALAAVSIAVVIGAGISWDGPSAGSAVAPHAGSKIAQTDSSSPAESYYLALGDSVPVWGPASYPNLLLAQYQRTDHNLQLVNLAVSGATTASMLDDGQYSSRVGVFACTSG